jgi:hypothetical protein
VKPFNPTIG